MKGNEERRVCIKFCVNSRKTFTEIFYMYKQLLSLGLSICNVQCGLKGSKNTNHQLQTILVQQRRLTTIIMGFFDWKGIVYNEFLLRDETINRFRHL